MCQQFGGQKSFFNARDQRGRARLVEADRKVTVTQITTPYNSGVQKSISVHTMCQTSKWIGFQKTNKLKEKCSVNVHFCLTILSSCLCYKLYSWKIQSKPLRDIIKGMGLAWVCCIVLLSEPLLDLCAFTYITCHLADTFIQSNLQLIWLDKAGDIPPGAMLQALLKGPTAVLILSWLHQGLNHRPCGSKSSCLTATLQAAPSWRCSH